VASSTNHPDKLSKGGTTKHRGLHQGYVVPPFRRSQPPHQSALRIPAGMKASSRWLSVATPTEMGAVRSCIPAGMPAVDHLGDLRPIWHPCRGAGIFLRESGGVVRASLNHRLLACDPSGIQNTAPRTGQLDAKQFTTKANSFRIRTVWSHCKRPENPDPISNSADQSYCLPGIFFCSPPFCLQALRHPIPLNRNPTNVAKHPKDHSAASEAG
jgi:hypothetical protein